MSVDKLAWLVQSRKCFDSANAFNVTNTGNQGNLNATVVGSDYNNRIGRAIHNRALSLRLVLSGQAATVIQDQFIRVILYYDLQPVISPPTGTDILTSVLISSHTNFLTKNRFTILLDKVFIFPYRQTTAALPVLSSDVVMKYHEEIIPLDLPTIYGNNSIFITGGIGYFAFGTVASPSGITASISTRLFFDDT